MIECPEFHSRVSFGNQLFSKITRGKMCRPVVLQGTWFSYVTMSRPTGIRDFSWRTTPVGRASGAVVNADTIPRFTTQKLPDGTSAYLPENIPKGKINGTDRAQFGTARSECTGPFIEEPPMMLDGQGVTADQSSCHPVVNDSCCGMGYVIGFAVTDESFIGMNAQQHQSRHNIMGKQGFDRSDFQV